MPTACELPDSVARWRPDPARAALLVHDMQRYFVDFLPARTSPTTELLANIGRLRTGAYGHGIPVVYSAQPGRMTREGRGLLYDIWGPGMGADPADREIVAELAPRPGDLVVTKYRYSAFHRTNLADRLAAAGRDQLVVSGVYAHLGCLLTACDAFANDIEVFVVADAVADLDRQEHLTAMRYLARRCAVTLTTRQLLAGLAATPPGRGGGWQARPARRYRASGRSGADGS